MTITARMRIWGRRTALLGMSAALLAGAVACNSSNTSSGSPTVAGGATAAATSGTAPSNAAPSTPAPISVSEPAGTGSSSAATSSGASSAATSPSPTTALTPTTSTSLPPAQPAAAVIASPAFGTSGISPTQPISIAVKNGTIKALSLVNPTGKVVAGKLSADDASWTLGEDLGYGKTYTVKGTALGRNGQSVPISGTYTTLTPDDEAHATISPGDGDVVGVAAPIIVRFSSDPTSQKAEIEKRMKVVTTPAGQGSWAWITHDGDTYPSLDWRPKVYWPQYTKVHVEADVYGAEFSDSVYGSADATSDFTIGRNQVVIANAKNYDIVVQQSGKTVATYPGSYGMGDDPNSRYGLNPELVTRSGIHIVMDKQQTVSMSNPKYGYTNSIEHWAVRISDNGEFIHENPNTVGDQGNTNVSHGCINLSAESAEAYYNSAIYGDPVQISGTSVQLSAADGDIYDWALSWSTWQSLSAL
ncbi:lipoprotein-anchoring transpeptidase ErfK/SrfK [Nakamurella sp. UYEF19]|uniref:L,D-transpeptidase n=1 Tax=Nakamurella sp. UYEF19 TaxID=1756392 RepID=UPI00339A5574